MSGLSVSPHLKKDRALVSRSGRVLQVRIAALVMLLAWLLAAGILAWQLRGFVRATETLPQGVVIAGLPVGNLTRAEAEARLNAVYLGQPLELYYGGILIQLPLEQAGVQLDHDAMFAGVQMPSAPENVAAAFWDYLWSRRPVQNQAFPLQASYSTERLRIFLQDVAARYDQPAYLPFTDVGAMLTVTGTPGYSLDIEASLPAIQAMVLDPDNRRADLVISPDAPAMPELSMLQDQITGYLANQALDGLFSLYMVDLQRNQTLHINLLDGRQLIGTDPDIAYSGMSIMKIIIMTEFYRQIGDDGALPYELDLVEKSITESSNWTANLLINWIGDLDDGNGLYRINETITALGMESTFLGGLYDTEELPGFRFTPANSREDISTGPDPYMQTTPADMGRLMEGIYRCANGGTGLLIDTNRGQWTPKECQAMMVWLQANRIGVLVEAGVPEGTPVAHKHAWGDDRTIGDSSIVLTAGGDYVLVYYIWRPDYAYWDVNSAILSDISRAVYHYFNPITLE